MTRKLRRKKRSRSSGGRNNSFLFRHVAYDDAFRTMEQECDDALICFVNEMFDKNYNYAVSVKRLRNEHFIQDGKKKTEKRISDSHFEITYENDTKGYHIESESRGFDESISIRLFQYSISDALEDRYNTHEKVHIRIPHTGLLVLKASRSPPKKIIYEIESPYGDILSYDARVMCMKDFSLDNIFKQKLFFLLPFYFFNLEIKFDEYENSKEGLDEFTKIYCEILEHLKDTDEADLSLRSKGIIIEEMKKVVIRLAYDKKKIIKKVGDIMGGKVHKLEWLERFDAAVAKGRAEGKAEGRAEGEQDRIRLEAEVRRLREENEKLRAATI